MTLICPISSSQPAPGKEPPLQAYQNKIAQIPWATDLRSAIHALNQMAAIIRDILRTGPHVNNIYQPRQPNQTEQGQDYNPHYINADWIQESRNYKTEKLINPDDPAQFIEIPVLTDVTFVNQNTSFRLDYHQVP